MQKEFFILLAVIFAALGALYFWVGTPTIYHESQLTLASAHLFQNPKVPIEEIHISTFYFVPKNKKLSVFAGWKGALRESLEKLQKFHDLEFQGRSKITFDIYPEPVIGLKNNLEYDTLNTNGGNPHALLSVAAEIENRALVGETRKNDVYPVMFILYEGVGASGGEIRESGQKNQIADIKSVDGFSLLGRVFLTDPQYKSYGATLLAHEFYHTLGIDDAYEQNPDFAVSFSEDIMGSGRTRQLENTYLSRETLKNLGI